MSDLFAACQMHDYDTFGYGLVFPEMKSKRVINNGKGINRRLLFVLHLSLFSSDIPKMEVPPLTLTV